MPRRLRVGFPSSLIRRNSLKIESSSLSDRTLWVTFQALPFIESLLTSQATVFEYGSGGSTVFYSKRVKQVISVEHDANWFSAVKRVLAEEEISNCHYHLIPPDHASKSNGSPEDPEAYCSSDPLCAGRCFYKYVTLIDSFPDQFFDFVAIDGRARPSCVLRARCKVKVGGYLMLDNSERPHYRKARDLLWDWDKHEFYGPGPYSSYLWETTIWKRVKS